ncbi:hypothetical protein TanjilG_16514 [Lupinus angustifolius]|uniref:Ribosomal protein L2 C-terminal domain-containing protein n=1 Tax=Lupinus angustifolius TaxID=3871 RepID=A0A1J7HR36_LUPAN|nr:hypothetical protein TanjilG_16514 [Lupinus angustifolius]
MVREKVRVSTRILRWKCVESILNNMAIHLYKTSTPSTRNGVVDSQVNPRKNLIYGHHHCGKGRNARGIINVGHRGGAQKNGRDKKHPSRSYFGYPYNHPRLSK